MAIFYVDSGSFGAIIVSGSILLSGSTQLQGTASWATNVSTASTADNFTVRGNLIVSGNTTIGDATTDSITMNAVTMSLGSGTGILNIDSNTFVVDGANNRVGILKSNPSTTLDVNGNAIITGSLNITADATASIFASTNNGNGTNFKVGDDAWIGDINVANTIGIQGQQTAASGYIKFGGGSLNPTLGSSGTSNLELVGSLSLSSGSITLTTGSITMPNRPAFRVTGAGGGKTAVTVLSGSYLNVDYQQGSGWNNATGTFTAPIAGLYQVDVVVRTNSNSLGTISQLIVYKNNTSISPLDGTVQVMVEFGANTTMNHAGGSTIAKLAAGDTLKMVVAVGQISFDSNDNFSVAYIG